MDDLGRVVIICGVYAVIVVVFTLDKIGELARRIEKLEEQHRSEKPSFPRLLPFDRRHKL